MTPNCSALRYTPDLPHTSCYSPKFFCSLLHHQPHQLSSPTISCSILPRDCPLQTFTLQTCTKGTTEKPLLIFIYFHHPVSLCIFSHDREKLTFLRISHLHLSSSAYAYTTLGRQHTGISTNYNRVLHDLWKCSKKHLCHSTLPCPFPRKHLPFLPCSTSTPNSLLPRRSCRHLKTLLPSPFIKARCQPSPPP